MSWESHGLPILRVEAWHASLAVGLTAALAPLNVLEPLGLLLGALFMGVNFLLLAYGIRWIIMPFASKGRVRAGIFLLVFKFVFLLVCLWLLLTRVSADEISFAVGVTCLILAILVDRLYDSQVSR